MTSPTLSAVSHDQTLFDESMRPETRNQILLRMGTRTMQDLAVVTPYSIYVLVASGGPGADWCVQSARAFSAKLVEYNRQRRAARGPLVVELIDGELPGISWDEGALINAAIGRLPASSLTDSTDAELEALVRDVFPDDPSVEGLAIALRRVAESGLLRTV